MSKSRNLALKMATSNWCLIADDDLVYLEGFESTVLEGITLFKNSGVIVFKTLLHNNLPRREYYSTSKKNINYFETLRISSVEMLIDKRLNVLFDENFGLGSEFFSFGEEQVYCFWLKKKFNYSISFFNKPIVKHNWMCTGRDNKLKGRNLTKGAIFYKIFPNSYILWFLIQFLFDYKDGNVKLFDIFQQIKQNYKGVEKLKSL